MRVAIVGEGPEVDTWASALSERELELLRAESLGHLLELDADLALLFGGPSDLTAIGADLGARPATPPLTILVRSPGCREPHPHTRLVRALVDARHVWESLFDAMEDPVVVLDSKGMLLRANLALARGLGRPIEEIVATPLAGVLGEATGPADPIALSQADGGGRTQETTYSRLPGFRQVTVTPVDPGPDGVGRLLVVLKDVTGLKEQQEQLFQAARLADIGLLAAGVAHEINTPLANIALRTESLLDKADDPRLRAIDVFDKFPRYLKTIESEVYRCKGIIAALLDFSRSRKPETTDVDLNAVCEKVRDLVAHEMRIRKVTLQMALHQPMTRIRADEGRLTQALITLVMNALDATPAGGHVTVETTKPDAETVGLAVSDDGAGILPEHLDKIFDPFFTTKPVGKGTGLGLAICHGVVTAHGGEIDVKSARGQGTCFSIRLPRRPAAAGPAEAR